MNKDPLVKEIKKISKKNKKWILIGSIAIKDKNKYKNRSIMVGPKGNIVTYYDKILRIEYSINHLGEKGVFLHFSNPFGSKK